MNERRVGHTLVPTITNLKIEMSFFQQQQGTGWPRTREDTVVFPNIFVGSVEHCGLALERY